MNPEDIVIDGNPLVEYSLEDLQLKYAALYSACVGLYHAKTEMSSKNLTKSSDEIFEICNLGQTKKTKSTYDNGH